MAGRYRDNLEELKSRQKPSRGAPAYSLYVNRPLGRSLAAGFALTPATPNVVSLVSFALSGAGLAAIAFGPRTPAMGVVVTAMLALGYAVDSADGQLARLRGGGSTVGEWLDHTLDSIKLSCLHSAVLVSVLRTPAGAPTWSKWVAIVFAVVAVVSFFGMVLTDLLRRNGHVAPPERSGSWLFHVIGLPTDYGIQCLWFLTWGWSTLFFGGYAVLAAAGLAHFLVASFDRYRSLSALEGGAL